MKLQSAYVFRQMHWTFGTRQVVSIWFYDNCGRLSQNKQRMSKDVKGIKPAHAQPNNYTETHVLTCHVLWWWIMDLRCQLLSLRLSLRLSCIMSRSCQALVDMKHIETLECNGMQAGQAGTHDLSKSKKVWRLELLSVRWVVVARIVQSKDHQKILPCSWKENISC
jgi:hypothetical protein